MVGSWLDMGSTDILHLMYLGKGLLKLGKKIAPANHGGHRRPRAVMVPHPRHQCMQRSADMLRNRSTSLKLEKTILITINFTIMCTMH